MSQPVEQYLQGGWELILIKHLGFKYQVST